MPARARRRQRTQPAKRSAPDGDFCHSPVVSYVEAQNDVMTEQARRTAEIDLLRWLPHHCGARLTRPRSLGSGDLAQSLTAQSTDPLLSTLAKLCTAHPTWSKWVVLSSRTLGLTLGERLAREGTSWLNLRFTTPWDLALRTAAPWLVEQGLDPTPEDLGPALVMRLLRG
jgi:hypothetical protein